MIYKEEIKIPKDRIPILIGKEGETKKLVERSTKTKINIDSETGDIVITSDESINCFITKTIIKAIGRGFNPDIALTLLNEENLFEVINIQEFSKKSKKRLLNIKARIIGTKGKAKSMLEQLTHTNICVYGKTVSIVGRIENVMIAKHGIESLLNGAPHGNVYRLIEDQLSPKNNLA